LGFTADVRGKVCGLVDTVDLEFILKASSRAIGVVSRDKRRPLGVGASVVERLEMLRRVGLLVGDLFVEEWMQDWLVVRILRRSAVGESRRWRFILGLERVLFMEGARYERTK